MERRLQFVEAALVHGRRKIEAGHHSAERSRQRVKLEWHAGTLNCTEPRIAPIRAERRDRYLIGAVRDVLRGDVFPVRRSMARPAEARCCRRPFNHLGLLRVPGTTRKKSKASRIRKRLALRAVSATVAARRKGYVLDGRGERIRTSGPCVPNAVLYQTELLPEGGVFITASRNLGNGQEWRKSGPPGTVDQCIGPNRGSAVGI